MDSRRSSKLHSFMLARNTFLNLLGNILPLAAAVMVMPHLIRELGAERFGVLSLIWIVIGYFGLFDLGIGRATTKFVSEHIAQQETEQLRATARASLIALTSFGVMGGVALAALNRTLVVHVLQIPVSLQKESIDAFNILALSIPFLLASTGARGILEAHRRFGIINAIKIPIGVGTIIAPLMVLSFSHNLRDIAAALLLSRTVDFAATFLACRKTLPALGRPKWPQARLLKQLIGYGGWLTVTSVVGPLMTYLDRFIVGGMLTMSAVTYYSTPYDVVTKQLVIPASLLGAVFPTLAGYAAVAPRNFVELYERSVAYLITIMTPAAIILLVLAGPVLNVWLGEQFSLKSTSVVQLLALGVLLNGVAQAPYAAIQALGRPDITAKLHMVELPFYILVLWASVTTMGITGAALAWLARAAVDTTMLFLLCNRILPCRPCHAASASVLAGSSAVLVVSAWLGSNLLTDLLPKFVFLVCWSAIFALISIRIMRRYQSVRQIHDDMPEIWETGTKRRADEVISHV